MPGYAIGDQGFRDAQLTVKRAFVVRTIRVTESPDIGIPFTALTCSDGRAYVAISYRPVRHKQI